MIVLDTNVVSEPLKLKPDVAVMTWLSVQAPETLFITTITIAEMLTGIEKMSKGRKRNALGAALSDQVLPLFSGRVLDFNLTSAAAFSKVIVTANAVGNDIDFADAAIVAVSVANGFFLATRNVRDFRGVAVDILNPWALTT